MAPPFSSTLVDGVLRYPPTGIKVLIVGAGVAGMFAALECWRKGNDVEIIEKASKFSAAGDIVLIGPSAWPTLHKYPSMLKEYLEVGQLPDQTFYTFHGTKTAGPAVSEWDRPNTANHAAYPLEVRGLMGRNEVCAMLLHQCERLSIPITWGVDIVDYEDHPAAEYPKAIAVDGKVYSGDVILAADGIGTKSHKITLGRPVEAKDTGYTCYRVMFPASKLKSAPLLTKFLEENEEPKGRLYTGDNMHCVFVITRRHITVVLTVLEENVTRDEVKESWKSGASSNDVLASVGNTDGWDPLLVEAINNTPEQSIIRWKLCMRDPQPKWLSDNGRLLQIGDAAHSFIPTSANGACTAIEDCLSVGECLRLGGGKEGASIALKVHEFTRYQRVTLVQRTGFENRRMLHHKTDENQKENWELKVFQTGKWHWGHNVEQYATENFHKARAHLESGAPFEHKNLPPGHKFEEWTLEGEMAKEKSNLNLAADLRSNGDWGVL
ncbi:FAD/NAD(P)-binding domain-containing protein [Camillea tinctor]|nr:FAD/NAD(P)-binding domain-containing protein [Camillea tinctor]